MQMACNTLKSSFVALFFIIMVLSPMLPCEAARLSAPGLAESKIICPACVCCTPAPKGSCCKCCASPIETISTDNSDSP